jgi:hypothetical protein
VNSFVRYNKYTKYAGILKKGTRLPVTGDRRWLPHLKNSENFTNLLNQFLHLSKLKYGKMAEEIKEQWHLDENEYVTFQKVVDCPKIQKSELYKRAMGYFVDNYSDFNSVIQDRDVVKGIIMAKGVFRKVLVYNSILKNSVVDTWHILKAEVKDGRAKITLSLIQYDESVRGSEPPDIHYLYPITKQYPFNPAGYQKDLYEQAFNISQLKAVETIASVERALLAKSTQNKNDNW